MKRLIALFLLYFMVYLSACVKPRTTHITIHSAGAFFFSFSEYGISPHLDNFNRDELGMSFGADSTSERVEYVQDISMIQSAYAMEDPNRIVYENSIDSVKIYTKYNFNDKFPSSSLVNDIIKPMDHMGNTHDVEDVAGMSFAHRHFKFSEIPTYDTMQFLVTGHISGIRDFEVITKLVVIIRARL